MYDIPQFFKYVTYKHLNQGSEEWENRLNIYFWDLDRWIQEPAGFREINMKTIDQLEQKDGFYEI